MASRSVEVLTKIKRVATQGVIEETPGFEMSRFGERGNTRYVENFSRVARRASSSARISPRHGGNSIHAYLTPWAQWRGPFGVIPTTGTQFDRLGMRNEKPPDGKGVVDTLSRINRNRRERWSPSLLRG